jgi:hypothetical protein
LFGRSKSTVKVFVSYPHAPEHHARLARRVVEKLREEPDVREVWFDDDHLLAGDDWPQEIVDGILASDVTIGFCLDTRFAIRGYARPS